MPLLSRVHFAWSGSLTIVHSIKSVMAVQKSQKLLRPASQVAPNRGSKESDKQKTIEGQKRRLLQIALMASVCVLLNTGATIFISNSMDRSALYILRCPPPPQGCVSLSLPCPPRSWSRSSDHWLTCSLDESFYSRNWDAYSFETLEPVCSQENIVEVQRAVPCESACV
jgi:hypothetical protein